MFHTRYGRKGGEGFYGRNIRGFWFGINRFCGGQFRPGFQGGIFRQHL